MSKTPKQAEKGRDTKVISCTGTTGTGKSTLAMEIAKKLATNDRVLVLTFAGSGDTWNMCKKIAPEEKALKFKKGWHKIHVVEHGKDVVMWEIYQHFTNGVVIFDDCKLYLPSNWDNIKGLAPLCVDHRFKGLDIIFIGHSPLHISRQCWAYIKFCWVFKCTSKLNPKDMPMENYEKFAQAQEEINRLFDLKEAELKQKPRGLYKYIRV